VAECCTRPQYVLRSYWETGKSRLPGSEDVISRKKVKTKQQLTLRARESFLGVGWSLGGLMQRGDIGSWVVSELGPHHKSAIKIPISLQALSRKVTKEAPT
jgi:hypothetical protein